MVDPITTILIHVLCLSTISDNPIFEYMTLHIERNEGNNQND